MNEELRMKDIFLILKKRKKSIILITIFIGILSGILNFFVATPIYKSSTRIFIGARTSPTEQANINDVRGYKELIGSYAEILNSSDLIDKSIEKANIDRTREDIIKNFTIKAISDTQIIQITYKDKDRYIVKEILDSISDEFIDEVKEITPGGKAKVIDKVQVPSTPDSPKKITNIFISIILGIVLSSILALLIENFNDEVKSINQIENELGLEVIGVIPAYKIKKETF